MKLLTFARKAKALSREILYGWYMKTLSAEEILVRSGGSFTIIGANLDEYFPFLAQRDNLADMQRRQDNLPALVVEDDVWGFTPLGPEEALVCGCCRLRTVPGSGLVLSERPRMTLLFHAEGEQVLLRHMHISFASEAEKLRHSLLPEREASYEYMGELAVAKSGAAFPELTRRQKLVLYYLTRGLPYHEVAGILRITPRTVRYYVTEIEKRLQVENRIQLIDMAFRRIRKYRGGVEQTIRSMPDRRRALDVRHRRTGRLSGKGQ